MRGTRADLRFRRWPQPIRRCSERTAPPHMRARVRRCCNDNRPAHPFRAQHFTHEMSNLATALSYKGDHDYIGIDAAREICQ